jgi:hypothetical protein
MFALVVWSSLAAATPAAASYLFEGGTAAWQAVSDASLFTWAACCPFLRRHAVRLCDVGEAAAPYPTALVRRSACDSVSGR